MVVVVMVVMVMVVMFAQTAAAPRPTLCTEFAASSLGQALQLRCPCSAEALSELCQSSIVAHSEPLCCSVQGLQLLCLCPRWCSVVAPTGALSLLHLPKGEHTKVTNDHPVKVRQREPQPPGGWVVAVKCLVDPGRIVRVFISYPCLFLLYI